MSYMSTKFRCSIWCLFTVQTEATDNPGSQVSGICVLQERLVSGPDQGQVRMCLQPTAEWQWLLVFISIPIVTCMYLAVLILMFSQTDVKSVCPDCYAVDCAPLLNLW